MTEPERKIENFVWPCIIGIRDNEKVLESNGVVCSNNVRSNGGHTRLRVTILLILTTDLFDSLIVVLRR